MQPQLEPKVIASAMWQASESNRPLLPMLVCERPDDARTCNARRRAIPVRRP